jgi:PAS domain S-box-containing protein
MPPPRLPRLSPATYPFVFALGVTAAAVALRGVLDPWLQGADPLVLLYAAVAVAATRGGYRPGILAAIAGYVLSEYFFVLPRTGFDGINVLYSLVYAGVTSAIIVVIEGARRVRLQAAQERESLRVTLDSIGDAVITTDNAGRVSNLNPMAEALTGWIRAEALGKPIGQILKLIGEETRQPVEIPVMKALEKGMVNELTSHTVLIARDGTERPIDDSAAVIKDAAGQPIGVVMVLRDASERRRYEKNLQYLNRRKDEFLATLAHELRNPLAALRNAVQVLLEGPPTEARHSKEVIDRQARQLTRLMDDLLDSSRIVHNELELRKERVNLAEVVQAAIDQVRPRLEGEARDLRVDLPPRPVYLLADAVRLAQALFHLLDNAVKYTTAGGHIRLRAEAEGDQVLIAVTDDGIGIEPDRIPRIFDVYSRSEPMYERARSGLGLGLSLVHGLVGLHGGSVEARSAGPGKGSEFIIRLPMLSGARIEETLKTEPEPAAPPRRSVLVVDDVQDSADSLAMLLRMMGQETHVAYSGESGLAIAESLRPEIILLDIGMPTMNGFEVCRRIRSKPWGKEVFVAALTGWGQEDAKLRSADSGFDYHLVKPVSSATLRKLFAYLPRRREAG